MPNSKSNLDEISAEIRLVNNLKLAFNVNEELITLFINGKEFTCRITLQESKKLFMLYAGHNHVTINIGDILIDTVNSTILFIRIFNNVQVQVTEVTKAA